MAEHIAAFREKFRCDELELWRGNGWCLSVRPEQLTYGSMVLSVLTDRTRFSDIDGADAIGFLAGLQQAERLAIEVFGASKVNYLALMMVDPVVHFHIFPRYNAPVNKHGFEWTDNDFPKPISVQPAPTDEAVLKAIWTEAVDHVGTESQKSPAFETTPEWLLRQLFHAQEQLNHHYMYEASARDELQRLRETVSAQQARIVRLTSSVGTSKRSGAVVSLIAPLRRVLSPLKTMLTSGLLHRYRLTKDAALVRTSGYFDEEWYLNQYPDVRSSGIDPAFHFVANGGLEGRHPGPHFDSAGYLARYPDVSKSGVNPLVHYLKFGRAEGRTL